MWWQKMRLIGARWLNISLFPPHKTCSKSGIACWKPRIPTTGWAPKWHICARWIFHITASMDSVGKSAVNVGCWRGDLFKWCKRFILQYSMDESMWKGTYKKLWTVSAKNPLLAGRKKYLRGKCGGRKWDWLELDGWTFPCFLTTRHAPGDL